MIVEILEYTRTLGDTVKKSDVEKALSFYMKNIDKDIIPTLNGIIKSKSKSIEDNTLLNNIRVSSEVKSKDNLDFISKLKTMFTNISKKHKSLDKMINDEFEDFIVVENLTVKQATLLKVINDFGSLSLYVMDLLYLVIMDTDETSYPKYKVNNIRNNISTFNEMLRSYYGKVTNIVDGLAKVSDMKLGNAEGDTGVIEVMASKSGKLLNLPSASGFIGNPIYHIRMLLVDREIEKYEALKEKRKLIELRLMELKLEENGEGDPKLKKQIEYYEEKLSKIDYEITQIEEDV